MYAFSVFQSTIYVSQGGQLRSSYIPGKVGRTKSWPTPLYIGSFIGTSRDDYIVQNI